MKQSIKIFLLIIVVLLIPISVNVLFEIDTGLWFLQAKYNPADLLNYLGVIIAAMMAMYGVIVTIRHAQENFHEDTRHKSLPFLSIENLMVKSRKTILDVAFDDGKTINQEKNNQVDYYKEFKPYEICYILENGEVSIKDSLNKEQQTLLENGGIKPIYKKNQILWIHTDCVVLPINVVNVGNGPALRTRIGFNKKIVNKDERQYISQTGTIKISDELCIRIFSEDCSQNSKNLGDYELEFFYTDVLGNVYKQGYDVKIDFDEEKSNAYINISCVDKQERVEDYGKNENGVN